LKRRIENWEVVVAFIAGFIVGFLQAIYQFHRPLEFAIIQGLCEGAVVVIFTWYILTLLRTKEENENRGN